MIKLSVSVLFVSVSVSVSVVVSVFSRSFLCEHKNANPQEMKKKMEREGKSAPIGKEGEKNDKTKEVESKCPRTK